MTNTNYLESRNITLSDFGKDCMTFAEGNHSIPAAEIFGKAEYKDAENRANAVFVHLNNMAKLRQNHGSEVDLKGGYDLFKSNLMAFYALLGERINGQRKMNAVSFTDEKNGEQTADVYTLGKICAEFMDKPEKEAFEGFYHALCLYAGNVLAGNGKAYFDLKEVRAKDLKAQKAKNAEKAQKAKETKERNEKAKAETAANQKAMAAELENLRANAINVTELIARINATSATDTEKTELIAWIINPESEKTETEAK